MRLRLVPLLTLLLAAHACSSDEPAQSSRGVEQGSPGDDAGRSSNQGKTGDAGRADGGSRSTRSDARVPSSDDDPPLDGPPRETLVIDECADGNGAGLQRAEVDKLKAGGSGAGMRFLYPYAHTVFPRGLGAPLVMWDGGPGAAVYVHITADAYEYNGCVRADAEGRIQLSQAAWEGAEQQTLGRPTPFTIELSTLDGDTSPRLHSPRTARSCPGHVCAGPPRSRSCRSSWRATSCRARGRCAGG